jgi:MoxR-like ATPase
LDVFQVRDRLIGDYEAFTRGFLEVRDQRIRAYVDEQLARGLRWPDPWLALNPSFQPGGTIDELVDAGVLHEGCRPIFRVKRSPDEGEGSQLTLYRHQREAIEVAATGGSYVLTTGTGSGKSLSYLVPIVDRVLREGSGRGVCAIVVYPMNALANSQRGELSKFLVYGFPQGRPPVTFARYTGQESDQEREEILGDPPDIILTNYVMLELLADKRQVVFYGPPGTGKTFVAKRLAEHLAGVDDVRLVQFHPSYSYEDFFEGFRPRLSTEGQLGFELVPGPFRRMVDAAKDDPAHPHVLVIDEINRGNLAKVFGELYFLLEYRDEPIELLYSPEESDFRLPENVFLIGTMNTADRSIALVDAAMRRRFAFQGFFPGRYPIRDLLRAWLRREGLPTRPADLLDELNARIADEDFAIGPSYLMTRRVDGHAGLERIWRTAILPLLEEHYFGQGRDLNKEFGLAALIRAVDAATGEQAGRP